MTAVRAGRSSGLPSGAKPSSTRGAASAGSSAPNGASSDSLPCSTSIMAATEVIALVMEAIQNTVSVVIAALPPASRRPAAPW